MINFANLKLPRLSLRLFLFILFALVILVLVAEGGYYFWIQRKKQVEWQATDWVDLIEGQINEIKGRTLIITVNDFNSLIPKKVEIEVDSEADIFIFPLFPSSEVIEKFLSLSEEEFERAMPPVLFTDLKAGDTIQAGILTKLTETKFKAESIAVKKE